jgi:hypothetical protein
MLQGNGLEPKRTTMEHLTKRLTRRFLFGRATKEEVRFVVRHLLTQCPHCAALTRFILLGELSPEVLLMSEAEAVAQAQLDLIVKVLEILHKALREIDATLPPSPQELSKDDHAEGDPDVTSEVRRVVQCVLTDRIDAAIMELTAASIYKPSEPEAEEEPGK